MLQIKMVLDIGINNNIIICGWLFWYKYGVFLKQKSDITEATESIIADTAPYGTVKRIRSDNGKELTCKSFKSLLVKYHIKHEPLAP